MLCLMSVGTANAAPPPSADVLMEDSDRARGGLVEGLTWTVDLESAENGSTTSRTYQVRGKGDNALAETMAPVRNKGEIILFNHRTLWFFKPGLKKPVAISARQRLSGQAANGDIASTNYRRDYAATVVGEETVGGDHCCS
jgi:hypothetical protein